MAAVLAVATVLAAGLTVIPDSYKKHKQIHVVIMAKLQVVIRMMANLRIVELLLVLLQILATEM